VHSATHEAALENTTTFLTVSWRKRIYLGFNDHYFYWFIIKRRVCRAAAPAVRGYNVRAAHAVAANRTRGCEVEESLFDLVMFNLIFIRNFCPLSWTRTRTGNPEPGTRTRNAEKISYNILLVDFSTHPPPPGIRTCFAAKIGGPGRTQHIHRGWPWTFI
jgi:hypothetical protein